MFSCGFWEVFWILASIFEFKKVLWILGCVLDLGTCFVLRPATVNSSNFRKKKKEKKVHRPRRLKRRILGEQKYLNFPKWVWIIYGLVQETNKNSMDFFYSLARWCNKVLKRQGKNFNLFVFFAVWCFPKLIPAKRWDLLNRPQLNRFDVTWCIPFLYKTLLMIIIRSIHKESLIYIIARDTEMLYALWTWFTIPTVRLQFSFTSLMVTN